MKGVGDWLKLQLCKRPLLLSWELCQVDWIDIFRPIPWAIMPHIDTG